MRNLPVLRLFGCLFLPVSLVLGGCSRNTPPKNHAVRTYPSPEAMAKWTDFSGIYRVQRLKKGDIQARHRTFLNETLMHSNAFVTVRQNGPTNMVIEYAMKYEPFLATNVIAIGKGDSPWTWVWDAGKAVFVERYEGRSGMYPGTASFHYTCVVSKAEDGTLTVESTRKSGGRWFWVKSWEEPVDRSVIQLVPAKPASTQP